MPVDSTSFLFASTTLTDNLSNVSVEGSCDLWAPCSSVIPRPNARARSATSSTFYSIDWLTHDPSRSVLHARWPLRRREVTLIRRLSLECHSSRLLRMVHTEPTCPPGHKATVTCNAAASLSSFFHSIPLHPFSWSTYPVAPA